MRTRTADGKFQKLTGELGMKEGDEQRRTCEKFEQSPEKLINEAGFSLGRELSLVGPVKSGIERELRVISVGPNPRMVRCEYWELESRRVCVVNVRNNRKWLKGMRFKMVEPKDETAFLNPWVYVGVQPRRKGRW